MPPPVPEKPPPVAVPAPELLSEHAPDKHVEPSPQVVHELPFVPHAELSKPERHSPEVSQQPVHVTEEHVRDGPHAEAVTTPSRRPKTNAGTVRSMRVRLPHSTALCLVTPVIQSSDTGNRGAGAGWKRKWTARTKFPPPEGVSQLRSDLLAHSRRRVAGAREGTGRADAAIRATGSDEWGQALTDTNAGSQ